jgi:hypothetical protein
MALLMSWGLERTNHGKRGTNSELANELKAHYFVGPHDADAGLSVLGSHQGLTFRWNFAEIPGFFFRFR